jgi:DNA-binding transcriptional regulator/RsmH inhibitor MraZ
MLMFVSEYERSIHGNRVHMPSKLRRVYNGPFSVSFEKELYEEREYRYISLTPAPGDVQPDNRGRLYLRKGMIEYLDYPEQVMILGVGERIELWRPDIWKRYLQVLEGKDFSDLECPDGHVRLL